MAQRNTQHLPVWHVLTVTADDNSGGSVRRILTTGDTATSYAPESVAASASVVVGPFAEERDYEIISDTGTLSYSFSIAQVTGTGAIVLQTALDLKQDALLAVTDMATNGAATIAPGVVVFTKAGVLAATLAAPTAAQAGTMMHFTAGTANAHTITATGLIEDGITGGAKDLATFAAFVGASLTVIAINLKWHVLSTNAVVIS